MRIQRNPSGLSFRRQRQRRGGCLSLAVLVGMAVGALAVSWNWIGGRLNLASPQSGDVLTAAAEAFERGDLDTTIILARQALERDARSDAALALLVRSLIYRSYSDYDRGFDRQAALEETTRALQEAPADTGRQAVHAYALQAAGQPVEAAGVAQAVLDRDPNNVLARVALALSLGSVGSLDSALRESERATQFTDWRIESLRALAISYSDLGQYVRAIEAVEAALALNRHLILLYFERALYALQLGDADSATAAYYQVLTYDPANVKARLRLCELSSLLREREAAVRYCSDVTVRAPEWTDGWYRLGLEYFLQGSFAQAQAALNRCTVLQIMQNVPVSQRRFECWYLQGQAAEILGDCEGLRAIFNEFRSMASDPSVQQTWTYPPEGPSTCAPETTPAVPAETGGS